LQCETFVAGDAAAVFWFFFSKKNCFLRAYAALEAWYFIALWSAVAADGNPVNRPGVYRFMVFCETVWRGRGAETRNGVKLPLVA
jgi:hypothetical protein